MRGAVIVCPATAQNRWISFVNRVLQGIEIIEKLEEEFLLVGEVDEDIF